MTISALAVCLPWRGCRHNELEPPCTDPYARWCGRGRWVTAAPMPILSPLRGSLGCVKYVDAPMGEGFMLLTRLYVQSHFGACGDFLTSGVQRGRISAE